MPKNWACWGSPVLSQKPQGRWYVMHCVFKISTEDDHRLGRSRSLTADRGIVGRKFTEAGRDHVISAKLVCEVASCMKVMPN